MAFYRRISPVEATYLAKDRLGAGQFVNQFFLEGELLNDEAFSETLWQKAIDEAARVNPGICLQLAGRWGFRYWRTTTLKPRLVTYTGQWRGDSSQHFEDIAEYINPRKDHNASIVLVKTKQAGELESKAIILFRIHHGLCDGAATAHWIQEIFRAIKGEKLLGSVSTLNETDIIKRSSYPKPDTFRGLCLPVFPRSSQAQLRGCHWVKCHWDIPEERIVAKLLLALRQLACEEHGAGKTVFRLTSDLRHHFLAHERNKIQFSNLSGIFDIEVTDGDTVKSIQFRIIKALRNKRDLSVFPKRMISLSPWLPGKMFNLSAEGARNMHTRGVCNISAMIGYANHIDLEAVSFDGFRATGAFAIPMNIEDKSVFMGVASSPLGIDVIISAPNALSDIDNTKAFGEKLQKRLQALDGNP